MIIIRIIGGLGNQMFQYAAGRCLAAINKTVLKLDTSAFEQYKLRKFDLSLLQVNAEIATAKEIKTLYPSHNLEKALLYIQPRAKRTYFREKHFHFDRRFYDLGPNVYLKGYFQSELYFKPIETIIRKEFKPTEISRVPVMKLKGQLANQNSVAIHVRVGDLREDNKTNLYHGTVSASYIFRAIDLIKDRISNPVFYFFSDDIQWVMQNLSQVVNNNNVVSGKISKDSVEDLYLMSQCKHNIISNSSFSWWAAWLNENTEKLVIAPRKWFNLGPTDTQDLIPEAWIRI